MQEATLVNSLSRSEIRRRAGLTQLQLANLAGSSAPQICMWERGDGRLPAETILRIAAVLFEHLKEAPNFDNPEDLAQELTRATQRRVIG